MDVAHSSRMEQLLFALVLLATVSSCAQEQQLSTQNPFELVGKRVIVHRMPLCQPGTYTPDIAHAGKQATVISAKPNNAIPALSPKVMSRLAPEARALIEDQQKAATLLLQFEDGTKLDSCAPIPPKALSDYLELVPGQTVQSTPQVNSAASAPPLTVPTSPRLPLVTDEQANAAIERAHGKRHEIGLELNDKQTHLLSGLVCDTCSTSGYTIRIFMPESWIELQAARAFREMLPFTLANVTPEMRRPYLRVLALPSTADYLTGAGLSMASSVHRIVLTDSDKAETIQPLENSNSAVEDNSALRSVTYASAEASFALEDVDKLRNKTRMTSFLSS